MFGIVQILGFVTGLGNTIAQVTNNITDLQKQKVLAASNLEKQKIDQQIYEANARRDVLVAEAGQRVNSIFRMFAAIGPIAYLFKYTFWDKVMGSLVGCVGTLTADEKLACKAFTTDSLDTNAWAVLAAIIAFYFMYDVAAKSRK